MKPLTKGEIKSILLRIVHGTELPEIKKVAEHTLSMFSEDCPTCQANIRTHANICRIREGARGTCDYVSYVCRECGTLFRKYEAN